jgi:hypothetical protein
MDTYKSNSGRHLDIIQYKMHIAKCLVATLTVIGLAAYTFSVIGYFHLAEAIRSTEMSTHSIPQVLLIYNGHKYSMSPFVFAERGNLTKIQSPILPDTAMPELILQEGSTISFDLGTMGEGAPETKSVHNQVFAYAIDYEADVNSLHPLKKVTQNTFELTGISGINTLELHVLVPGKDNNTYISFTKLVDIRGNNNNVDKGNNSNQNGSSPNIETNSNNLGNINTEDNNANSLQSCGSSSGISPAQITSSSSGGSSSIPTSTNLAWSAAGEGSWIQLDLGQPKSICSLEIAFANGENSINFFKIQTSTDGVHFIEHGPFQNTGHVSGLEQYSFSDTPVTARFVKLMFQGSTQADSYNVTAMKVLGNR